jgi:hypothetical protein
MLAVLAAMAATSSLLLAAAAAGAQTSDQSGSQDADKICVYGDIDNLGFGFPDGFDVFAGKSTPVHSYPWPNAENSDPTPDEAAGTDRIMVGSSDKADAGGRLENTPDGYSAGSKRPDNNPQALKLTCDPGSTTVKAMALQLFVDDFQAPVFKAQYTATINGKHFTSLEQVINSLQETGPIGKLITVSVPANLQKDVLHGSLLIDDATTGVGDGFALDFARTLINPHLVAHAGTVRGRVVDSSTNKPIAGATVTAAGTVVATSAADGTFTLPDVPSGLAAVSASARGHVAKTNNRDLVAGQTITLDFALPPGTQNVAASVPASTDTGGHTRSSFTRTLVPISDISTKAGDLARSALGAVLLLALVVFPAELFNSTLSEHYDEVRGWFGPLARAADRAAGAVGRIPSVVGFVVFAAIAALIGCLLDPHFGLDSASIALFLGIFGGFVAVTLAFGFVERRYMSRRHEDRGILKVLPGTLLIGAICVLVSRIAGFQPGYLYGLLAGFVFAHELSDDEEGRLTAVSALFILLVSLVAWVVWTPFGHMAGHANPNIVVLLIDALLASVFIAGIESLVFGLVPMRFLEGEALYRWKKVVWGVVYALSLFAFVHILLHPGVTYSQTTSKHAFLIALVLFAIFAALSVGFWAFFRFRSPRPAADEGHAVSSGL